MPVRLQIFYQLAYLRTAFLKYHFLTAACDSALLLRLCRSRRSFGSFTENIRSYDHILNLVGSFINSTNLGITICTLHIHTLQIAISAKDLKRIIHYLQANIRCILFGHCRFHSIRLMVLL